jgi:penicillin amidase
VPGDTGEYEWRGFRKTAEQPRLVNPPDHYIATANHNILPPGYRIPLSYEWALPFRFERIREMMSEKPKYSVADFEQMQADVMSLAARRFQRILGKWKPSDQAADVVGELLRWDARLMVDSRPAAIYEAWISQLPKALFGDALGARVDLGTLLKTLETELNSAALAESLASALAELAERLGPDRARWSWGRLHQVRFRHTINDRSFHRGPVPRPGDAHTVNATGGADFAQTSGASYRQILDLSDWDKSMMTNVPGESGDPSSPHYDDLLAAWARGEYHPMPYSRKAVEAATVERIVLEPAQ